MGAITYKGYLRTKNKNALSGTIYVRVTMSGKHCYHNCQETLEKSYFNFATGYVDFTHPNAELLNLLIDNNKVFLQKKILTYRLTNENPLDFETLQAMVSYKGLDVDLYRVLELYKDYANLTEERVIQIKVAINWAYKLGFPKNINHVTLYHITHLRNTLLKSQKHNSVVTILNKLKTLFLYAVDENISIRNPFKRLKIGNFKQVTKYLTAHQISTIEKRLNQLEEHQVKIAQLFLFSCYTGLRYTDLNAMESAKIVIINNHNCLDYIMSKNKTQHILPIHPKAAALFKEIVNYKVTNQYYNRELKAIQKINNIPVKLTTHVARHTFATSLINSGVKVEEIKELMNHKDIRTTLGYAKINMESKIQAVNKIK